MKKTILFFLIFLTAFLSAASAYAFNVASPSVNIVKKYSFPQLKAAAGYLAKKGNVNLKFIGKTPPPSAHFSCNAQVSASYPVETAYACKMLYYDASWYQRNKQRLSGGVLPELTTSVYRYMLVNFLSDINPHYMMAYDKDKNTIYAWQRNPDKAIGKYENYAVENPDKHLFKECLFKACHEDAIPYRTFASLLKYNNFNTATGSIGRRLAPAQVGMQNLNFYHKYALADYNYIVVSVTGKTKSNMELAYSLIDAGNFSKAKGAINYFGNMNFIHNLSDVFIYRRPSKSEVQREDIIAALEMLYFVKRYKSINPNAEPWSKAERATILKELKELKSTIKHLS